MAAGRSDAGGLANARNSFELVEPRGFEPLTSAVRLL
jgi:hypothetical protein